VPPRGRQGRDASERAFSLVRTGRTRRWFVAGKFELYKDKAGKFRFHLKAGNGQVIAVGEAYETRASALNGIESIRKNAPEATLDDQTHAAATA
jgi:uncharacterized protein YegP (UPF0339 family)